MLIKSHLHISSIWSWTLPHPLSIYQWLSLLLSMAIGNLAFLPLVKHYFLLSVLYLVPILCLKWHILHLGFRWTVFLYLSIDLSFALSASQNCYRTEAYHQYTLRDKIRHDLQTSLWFLLVSWFQVVIMLIFLYLWLHKGSCMPLLFQHIGLAQNPRSGKNNQSHSVWTINFLLLFSRLFSNSSFSVSRSAQSSSVSSWTEGAMDLWLPISPEIVCFLQFVYFLYQFLSLWLFAPLHVVSQLLPFSASSFSPLQNFHQADSE